MKIVKSQPHRTQQAESAIRLLRDGITSGSRTKILSAYGIIEDDENFTWDGLDVIYMEWEELVDQGNDILNA